MGANKIFINQGKQDELAIIGQSDTAEQYYNYAVGYLSAADELINSLLMFKPQNIHSPLPLSFLEHHLRENLNTYIYPICFLYRQYLELTLKDIYSRLTNDTIEEQNKLFATIGHTLKPLWQKVKNLLYKYIPDIDREELNKVDNYILQFSDEDPSSTKYRYPISLKGKLNNPNIRKINITNLKDKMNEIESFFATEVYPELDMIKIISKNQSN